MSLNLSRNAVAMERALGYLADAEQALEDCSSCLARDVIVSEAQAIEHNRSIVGARNALHALRGQIRSEHGEICGHLRDAQMAFLQSKPLISLATGHTDGESNAERELDLSAFVYESNESQVAQSENVDGLDYAQETQQPFASSSSRSQQMVVQLDAESLEEDRESAQEGNSVLESALHDDDSETVKGFSDDGHSYAGTVVRGVLKRQQ